MKKSESSVVVVADTSGLMSLLVDTEANHRKALALSTLFEESPGAVIIPSHVFSELMNVLGKKLGHQVAVLAGKRILSNPDYLIVESDKELKEALERFAKQPASVSLTDCIVMALADRFGTKLILASMMYSARAATDSQRHQNTTSSLKRPVAPENVHSPKTSAHFCFEMSLSDNPSIKVYAYLPAEAHYAHYAAAHGHRRILLRSRKVRPSCLLSGGCRQDPHSIIQRFQGARSAQSS